MQRASRSGSSRSRPGSFRAQTVPRPSRIRGNRAAMRCPSDTHISLRRRTVRLARSGRQQVDDGTYRIVDEGTFVVSKEFPDVTFHYSIDGDSITFEPALPECSPDCFEAAWSVVVAFPGHEWRRAESGS